MWWGGGQRSRTPCIRDPQVACPSPLWPRLRSLAGESCSAAADPARRVCAAHVQQPGRESCASRQRRCSRGRVRERAGLQRGLTASAPARLPRASRDASGAAGPRGPWTLSRAWAGEGRRREVPIAVASAASATPEERRKHILALELQALPAASGGTRGKVNQSSKSREYAVSRSLFFIFFLRLRGGLKYMFSVFVANTLWLVSCILFF